uniref:Uncharacterized protein n=1 Tax=Oryza brachyantha TaxID=4533 RepID=J3KVH9_ORYBR
METAANMSAGAATVKPLAAACYDNNLVNSQGMFLGDQPLRFSLPLLLVQFDLVVVGRRGGGEGDDLEGSALTSGLSEWSECPELGVLGDMLASAEFASKVSILVVQQQQHAGTAVDP